MARRRAQVQTHVAFGDSATGKLIYALRELGRGADRVINIPDEYNVGPIAPGVGKARLQWGNAQYLFRPERRALRRIRLGMEAAIAVDEPIIWMSHRDAQEHCGLMEVLWRRRRPIWLIDVATLTFPPADRDQNIAFAIVGQPLFLALRLIDQARLVDAREVDAFATTWQALADEGEPLRVVTAHGLLGVPLDHFDDALVASASGEWMRTVRLIGLMLDGFMETGFRQVDAEFLYARIAGLIDAGRLEGRGDFESMLTNEVRRPAS